MNASSGILVNAVSQVSLTVSGDNIFRELQERVMKWAFAPERNLKGIPDGAWEGETFEIDAENSERAAAIKIEDPNYWAFRFSERLKDTNRIWTTEIGIMETNPSEVIFGCRLLCSQRSFMGDVPRSIPSFVRSIAYTKTAFLDGRETSADPWIVDNEETVQELVTFLLSAQRKHPVVVFSLPEGSSNTQETIIPVNNFLRRTAGYIHTAVITSDAAFALTDQLGAGLSVYRQAVRTYQPGFQPDSDLWADHPIATADRIRGWQNADGETFSDFLVQQSLRLTRPRNILEREQPPFHQIKALAAEKMRQRARNEGKNDSELLILAEDEIKAAKQETETSLEMALAADGEKEQALDEVRQIKASYLALQARVDGLQIKLKEAGDQEEESPMSLDQIKGWADRNLSGDVELHERAIKTVSNSDFEDVALVYDTLKIMRDYYVPMRRTGGNDKRKAYDERLAELGLEDEKCFSQENKAQNFGGTYFVRYQGQKRELDRHLKGRSSRDGRHGFRLYFFWDAETSRVVVGYLPGHLKNDKT